MVIYRDFDKNVEFLQKLFLDLISDNSIGGKNIMNYIVVAHTYVFAFLYAICRLGAILSTNKMHTFMCYFCT